MYYVKSFIYYFLNICIYKIYACSVYTKQHLANSNSIKVLYKNDLSGKFFNFKGSEALKYCWTSEINLFKRIRISKTCVFIVKKLHLYIYLSLFCLHVSICSIETCLHNRFWRIKSNVNNIFYWIYVNILQKTLYNL